MIQNLINEPPLSAKQSLILRLGVGAAFGFVICLLLMTFQFPPLRADMGAKKAHLIYDSLVFSLWITAFVFWAGAGTMRRLTHLGWCLIVGISLFFISLGIGYQINLQPYDNYFIRPVHFWALPLVFIANELVISADRSAKWIAPYETYFEEAWKRGIQLILALVFTGLFWGILLLGASLFKIIGFELFGDLISYSYVAWVLSGLAMGLSVHLGDVQTKMLGTVRLLVLTVFSWLLPLITIISIGFVIGLIFTGLAPLWATKAATVTMLAACVNLVLLMNAAYQQGEPDRSIHILLKWTLRAASIVLLTLSLIAAYSLSLRIEQYGLTFDRILAGIGVFISVLFGIGYTASSLMPTKRFMAWLETTNIVLAFVKVAIILGLLTPILDPNRLSVDSQVARLKSGQVSIDKFDWIMLRFDTEKYGLTALESLTKDPKFGAKATEVKKWSQNDRYKGETTEENELLTLDYDKLILVPNSPPLPKSFVENGPKIKNWYAGNDCTTNPSNTQSKAIVCYVNVIDLNRDSEPEVLLLSGSEIIIYDQTGSGWEDIHFSHVLEAKKKAFQNAQIQTVRPQYDDVLLAGELIQIPSQTQSDLNQDQPTK